MTKRDSFALLLSGVSALCLGLPMTANAADILYTGDGAGLQDAPSWADWAPRPDTLFPGSSLAPLESGNHVTIDYDPLVGSPTNPTDVYGGASKDGVVSGNQVDFLDGRAQNSVIGGLAWNGDAIGNSATVSGGEVKEYVYGGHSYNGAATDNRVTISGGKVGDNVYAGSSENGDAIDNSVSISGGEIGGEVYGSYSENGAVTDNRATISGGQVNWDVYGGRSENGDATGNSATVSGGLLVEKRSVYGGRSENSAATGNSATVSGGEVGGYAYGGVSQNGVASDNSATISDGLVQRHVYGGKNYNGVASGNSATVSGGLAEKDIYGGNSVEGAVTSNRATVSGGKVGVNVFGGDSYEGAATGNSATISGGEVGFDVYGANSYNGAVTGNSTTISAGLVGRDIYGGLGYHGVAADNSATVSGGEVKGDVFGGASEKGAVTDNSATVSGGEVKGRVLGGFSVNGAVTGNSAIISGGEVKRDVYGGYSVNGVATGNSVTISGGLVQGNVYGGYSEKSAATGNSVTISGGQVSGYVYGGRGIGGDSTYNTVTISGNPDLSASFLFGGGAGSGDRFTGNRLNIVGFTGSVAGLYNFEYYNFTLPAAIGNGAIVLDASAGASLGDARQSNVSVAILGGGRMQQVGESFVLIDANGVLYGSPANSTAKGLKGFSLQYDFDLAIANNQLVATVTGIQANPETKALSEGRAGGAAFVNQGADMIAAQGMGAALDATNGANAWAGFGAIGGGSSRYNTGSHVNVDGVSVVAGVGWRNPQPSGSLLVGVFVEAGWGNYDSHNSFTNAPSVKGDGDVDYYGGGVLGRYDFASGLYGEGSVRTGRASVDFASSNLSGVNANYDSSSTYYGAHAGLGYILPLAEQFNLDLSTKYLWTRQGSDSVTVANDPIQFKASNSHRWRNGARIGYDADNQFTPYVGAAYEYEFDGEAKSTTYGYAIDAPSLKGGTGIGELGVRYSPAMLSALSVDVGVQGYVGVREGVTGNLQVKYAF